MATKIFKLSSRVQLLFKLYQMCPIFLEIWQLFELSLMLLLKLLTFHFDFVYTLFFSLQQICDIFIIRDIHNNTPD